MPGIDGKLHFYKTVRAHLCVKWKNYRCKRAIVRIRFRLILSAKHSFYVCLVQRKEGKPTKREFLRIPDQLKNS